MIKNLLLIPLLIASLVIMTIHPVYATTPNTENYEAELSEFLDEEQFLKESTVYEELPVFNAQSAIFPDRHLLQLLPDLQFATEWKPLRTITEPLKEWRITFNQPVNVTEENKYKVKIFDESGVEIDPIISLKSTGIAIKPGDPYIAGMVYTLFVQSNLDNHKGKPLGKDIYQQFVYQPEQPEQEPEITKVTDLYSALYLGLKNMDDTIFVEQYTKDSKVAFAELSKVLEEHPEIFYYEYSGSLFYSDGRLEAKYAYPKETIKRMKANLQREIDALYASTIKPGMTEYEK